VNPTLKTQEEYLKLAKKKFITGILALIIYHRS
jgi:hypothetical protein